MGIEVIGVGDPGLSNPLKDALERAVSRVNVLSEQVNYLLRELYKSTNGQHGAFKRNPTLAEETKKAIELASIDRTREVKEQIPTPEFTREQIRKLNAEQNK